MKHEIKRMFLRMDGEYGRGSSGSVYLNANCMSSNEYSGKNGQFIVMAIYKAIHRIIMDP